MRHVYVLLTIFVVLGLSSPVRKKYTPDWKSLDTRPNPVWYDQAKIGIFVHWGVFSVPAFACSNSPAGAEWYWHNYREGENTCNAAYHNATYGRDFEYTNFGPMFTARLFDPDRWADLFVKSGAKYVVLTTKHHEGWCNYPSAEAWNWNSVDNGPKKDLTKLLTEAVKKRGIKMGLYHSLFEWYHPLWLADQANNFTTTDYVDQILTPQLRQIVTDYAPSVVWADGDYAADTYFKSKEFLAWLYSDSPSADDVVVNDRWGVGDHNLHGSFYSGGDRYNPGQILAHKWENCFTIDGGSWGFNINSTLEAYLSIETMLNLVVGSVAKNGNALINVGPTSEGLITPIFEERLTQLGTWLGINGEAIYESRPWRVPSENFTELNTWYTTKGSTLYLSFSPWPKSGLLKLAQPKLTKASTATLLGYDGQPLTLTPVGSGVAISLPADGTTYVSSKWMWTVALGGFL